MLKPLKIDSVQSKNQEQDANVTKPDQISGPVKPEVTIPATQEPDKSNKNNVEKDYAKELKKADNYVRVGISYYHKTISITSKGKEIPILDPWNKGIIKEDHAHINGFFNRIEKFSTFVNFPDHTDNYKRSIITKNGDLPCYNLYEPIEHKAKTGALIVTTKFISHIFGEYSDIGMDYLTLMYRNPTQNLPGLCLVSKERETGKTTFLNWLAQIYGNNAVILGNEDFHNSFNSHWASKLVIGIDESFIEKREILEKVKRYITTDRTHLENKGKDKKSIDFIGKFILNSNDETNFIPIQKEENRFFVIKVKSIQNKDPLLLEKLIQEIPAFIYELQRRKLSYERKSRLWFDPAILQTEALKQVIISNRSKIEKALIEYCQTVFDSWELDPNNQYEPRIIIKAIPKNLAYSIGYEFKGYAGLSTDIMKILKNEWGLEPSNKIERYDYPSIDFLSDGTQLCKDKETVGRPYYISKSLIQEKAT